MPPHDPLSPDAHISPDSHDPLLVPAVLLARFLACYAVRNTGLDDLHAGTFPETETGNFSDVTVQTPDGPIPWNEVSRLSDPEMRALMLEVEVQLARALQTVLEWQRLGRLNELLDKIEARLFGPEGVSWDRPDSRDMPRE